MPLPKTLFISINTHGGIDSIDKKNGKEIPITYIPSNIKSLYKIDATPLGIDNVIRETDIVKYINVINKHINLAFPVNKIDDCKSASENDEFFIDKCINLITNELKSICKNEIKNNLKRKFNNFIEDNDYKMYCDFVNYGKIFQTIKYKSNDKIINKTFCYSSDEKNTLVSDIKIINKEYENIDLFDLLIEKNLCSKYTDDGYEISLEKILSYLSTNGVEKIIMFDLTCSNVIPENYFNSRYLRKLRRDVIRLND